MKTIAILVNVVACTFMLLSVLVNGKPSSVADYFFLAVAFCFFALNIVALWRTTGYRDVISLYIERKKIEQEIKIAELRKRTNN